MERDDDEITARLREWSQGEPDALRNLLPLVVDELRRIAAALFRGEDPDHTLQPTALVNEVCLKLYGWRKVSWANRRQFFAFSSKLMRRLLIDYSRTRKATKRGRQVERVSLSDAPEVGDAAQLDPDDLLDLSRALDRLRKQDPRTADIFELRFFLGLSVAECTTILETSRATVIREWAFARQWLAREMGYEVSPDDPGSTDLSPSKEGKAAPPLS